jgi:hypothetical protein
MICDRECQSHHNSTFSSPNDRIDYSIILEHLTLLPVKEELFAQLPFSSLKSSPF